MEIDKIKTINLMDQLKSARKIEEYKLELQKAKDLNSQLDKQIRDTSFGSLLREKLKEADKDQLKISKHAQARADERGIDLRPDLLQDIKSAVDRAREKGIKDLVVIGKDTAFVVNVSNNILVTSMDKMEMEGNIFTNIDGAVII